MSERVGFAGDCAVRLAGLHCKNMNLETFSPAGGQVHISTYWLANGYGARKWNRFVKIHRNPVPVVENATPSLEILPKMQPLRQHLHRARPKIQPLRQKLQSGTCWLASWLAGWLAGCQRCIWDTKMRQKRVPLARKCVKHAYP